VLFADHAKGRIGKAGHGSQKHGIAGPDFSNIHFFAPAHQAFLFHSRRSGKQRRRKTGPFIRKALRLCETLRMSARAKDGVYLQVFFILPQISPIGYPCFSSNLKRLSGRHSFFGKKYRRPSAFLMRTASLSLFSAHRM
jgi:hypothetical protein